MLNSLTFLVCCEIGLLFTEMCFLEKQYVFGSNKFCWECLSSARKIFIRIGRSCKILINVIIYMNKCKDNVHFTF